MTNSLIGYQSTLNRPRRMALEPLSFICKVMLSIFVLVATHQALAAPSPYCANTTSRLKKVVNKETKLKGAYQELADQIISYYSGKKGRRFAVIQEGVMKIVIPILKDKSYCREEYPIKLCLDPPDRGIESMTLIAGGLFTASAKIQLASNGNGGYDGFTISKASIEKLAKFHGTYSRDGSAGLSDIKNLPECP